MSNAFATPLGGGVEVINVGWCSRGEGISMIIVRVCRYLGGVI